ncbi:hypothetical protein [Erwinia psidii]|uniref:Uncharacterized protein n=1 Tax=Erwinia psidii TaxID=69224 RepID=A0A3N6V0T2_9GAMM|nr:hypothetical protein [Erwinia psidii]MCX8955965.1 hypothetical protein [Erwinia psidii]MCX8961337.1 hypothetical protein [Erwinia psidii]MCX8963816.1 hypothetical protein [Erwinia psidii]RQM38675.1 hypothetical protein EB241_08235 [Erwinia psidii]
MMNLCGKSCDHITNNIGDIFTKTEKNVVIEKQPLPAMIHEVRNSTVELLDKNIRLNKENNRLTEKNTILKIDIKDNEDELLESKNQLHKLEGLIFAKNEALGSLRAEHENLSDAINNKKTDLKKLKSEINNLKFKKSPFQSVAHKLKKECSKIVK